MKYDVIVIGAGLSGLVCALLLSRSGRRVLVLEQSSRPAPVVRGFKRGDLYFDTGFHYAGGLGAGGAFRPLFRHLGLEEKLVLFPFDKNGFDHLRISATGETLVLPVGFAEIKRSLGQRFPGAQEGLEAYLDEVAEKWHDYPYLDLNAELADFTIESVHGLSLQERLEEFSAYPELQCLLSMHSLLFGVAAKDAPLTLNSQVAGSYYHSVHGIVGGGRALVDALLELLAAAGGVVRCQAEVTSLLEGDAAVRGVRLKDGEEIFADQVVATLNPSHLPQLLPGASLRPAYRQRLKDLRQTSSAYIVFAKSHAPLDFLRGCNLYVQSQPGVFALDADRPLEERSFYLSAAGQGAHHESNGLIAIVPANYAEVAEWGAAGKERSSGYARRKQELSDRLLKTLIRHCPELAGLEILELATPLTLRDYSLAPQGAIYGVGRYLGQYNPLPTTRIPGLFLSGQAVAASGFLGAVIASYLTCGSILGHEHLRREVRACL